MENWNIKEETGKQYVYVSKLGDDTLAKNYFGYADLWQSDTAGQSYVIGDRRRSSALSTNSSYVQYRAKTNHVKGATTPNADATNWEFDIDNFQEYLTTITYTVGSKTVYGNEHYVCNSTGTTGTFNLTKWDKVIVSNKDLPFLEISTTISLTNGVSGYNGGRFITSKIYNPLIIDVSININIIIGVGSHYFSLISTTLLYSKHTQIIGIDKYKSILTTNTTDNIGMVNYRNITYRELLAGYTSGGFINCIISTSKGLGYLWGFTIASLPILIKDNIIFGMMDSVRNYYPFYYYNNIMIGTYSDTTSMQFIECKNNYFSIPIRITTTNKIKNTIDYNCYQSGVYINSVLKSTIGDIKSADTNQNVHSIVATPTFTDSANGDYSLPNDSSPLYKTGAYGRNIGCTSIGFKKDDVSSEFTVAGGAVFKNIKIDTGKFVRDQINKNTQSATSDTIVLSTSASTVDNEYNGFRIKIVAGTGIGQTRTLTGYTGTNKTATVTNGWTITPDNTSIYDILDGEVYSAKIDLGRVVRVKNAQFFSNFISDVNGKYIEVVDWDVTSTSKQPKYTFKMNYSTDDITYSGLKEFLADELLRIDSNGYGNGDANFVRNNQVDATINVRYCYINFALREI